MTIVQLLSAEDPKPVLDALAEMARAETTAVRETRVLAKALRDLAEQVETRGLEPGAELRYYIDFHVVRDPEAEVNVPYACYKDRGQRTIRLEYKLRERP